MIDLFKEEGIELDPAQLGISGTDFNELYLHPAVFEINSRGMQVTELLESLSLLDPLARDFDQPLPVEYVPLLDSSAMFGERHKLRTKYHSSLVISALRLVEDTSRVDTDVKGES
jgi:hypothetical protein